MAAETERDTAEKFERTRIKDRLKTAGIAEVESDEVAALFIEMLSGSAGSGRCEQG